MDFRGELGLLKAARLYADRVRLVSVGGSTVAALDELRKMPLSPKLELIRKLLPLMQSDASPETSQETYRIIDSMRRSLEKGGKGRGLSDDERLLLRRLDKDMWKPVRNLVEDTLDEWGAVAFKVALRSGLVEVRPFAVTTPEELLRMELDAASRSTDSYSDEAYEEYRRTILEAVGDDKTYPLFDDLTGGDIVARAVRTEVIRPSPGDTRRSKQGELSGDLLRRLPMFEKAGVSEVLEIRDELSEHLGAFREAVATSAATIESAPWAVADFAEEADLVFRENVAPAVERIEQRVEDDRDLKELTLRYGPPFLSGATSMGAFLAGQWAPGSLAALAAGLSAVAAGRSQRKEVERQQLYFYYWAGKRLGRRR
ncbi:MAG: hypothetical protein M3385_05305 [Actinomycetota bacterium]|nr:hypothetical protein [Actinomycetota bacterium]